MKFTNKKVIKKNPGYYIVADAEHMLGMSEIAQKDGNENLERAYARSALLLYPLSLEAIINFVYVYFEVCKTSQLKRMVLKDKWLMASKKCLPLVGTLSKNGVVVYKPGDKIDTFDEKSEPFLSYWELKNIRNDFVHLKPDFRFLDDKSAELFVENSDKYPVTKIPVDISHIRFNHALIAKNIFHQMFEKLDGYLKGELSWIMKSPLFEEKRVD